MEDDPVLSGCVCDGTVNCPLARLERAVLDEHGVRGPGFKQFIARRRREDAANASINRELAILKRAFHLASANDPPRVYRIPHFPMLEEDNVRKSFLEEDAYKRLRDALPSGVQLLFVVANHVGCRVGELLKIRWSQVDLHAKRIRLEPGTRKNKQGRTLPIYGEMVERLRIEKEIRDSQFPACQHIFRRSGGRSRISANRGRRLRLRLGSKD